MVLIQDNRISGREHFLLFLQTEGHSRRLDFFPACAVTDLEREERSKLKRRSRKSVVGRVVVPEVTN